MASNMDRARQFMPFDALKGLQEALREKEKEIEERKELSEESLMELNKQLQKIVLGDGVKIEFYKNHQYVMSEGTVTNIDAIGKKIVLNDDEIISFFNIIKIWVE